MSSAAKLVDALSAIEWKENVEEFCGDAIATASMSASNLKLAIWSKQLEQIDRGNPALCFVREMQVSGHLVAASTALAMYKSAAASTRTVVETALYYSYFRTHQSELTTLVRSNKWYLSKSEIIEYHVTHTPDFNEVQRYLPVVSLLNPWYSEISAIIHGQIPGKWLKQKGISDIKPDGELRTVALTYFERAVDIVNRLFLCTVGREQWDYISTSAKDSILRGLPGQIKTELGLDSA